LRLNQDKTLEISCARGYLPDKIQDKFHPME
jgi:hypothetical protein